MNFQDLMKVEPPDFYLDLAIKKANKKISVKRGKKIPYGKSRLDKSRSIEAARIEMISNSLCDSLTKIIKAFPSLDHIPLFYSRMVKAFLDYGEIKQALGAIDWARKTINSFFKQYSGKIRSSTQINDINSHRRAFLGRISSVMKRMRNSFFVVETARRIMKGFPTVKTGLFTVAIAGFPNVGKTTLLNKLTKSDAKVDSYAFTTKGINIGYGISEQEEVMKKEKGKQRTQFLDVPGTLNRFEKMNNIEKQAYLAIKHCANMIIYVYDLTESSYPIKDQIKLHKMLRKTFKTPIVVYLSKMDMLLDHLKNAAELEQLKEHYHAVYDINELNDSINKHKKDFDNQQKKDSTPDNLQQQQTDIQ